MVGRILTKLKARGVLKEPRLHRGSLPAVAYTLAPMRCANLGITEPKSLGTW